MHLDRIVLRGFRNLRDLDHPLPPEGVVLLGPNAQGKTNFLEAIGYPVLFRALRGATDAEVAGFGGPGFRLEASFHDGEGDRSTEVTYTAGNRRKRILLDGAPVARLSEAVGAWVAVAFLPRDVALAGGPATERRQYLDRMLSLASADYLRALARYRAALAQRNAALRQGQEPLARAFDRPAGRGGERGDGPPPALGGRRRHAIRGGVRLAGRTWADRAVLPHRRHARGPRGVGGCTASGAGLAISARGMTTIGPHRDDLILTVDGRPLRDVGSTGAAPQRRGGAPAP